MEKQDRCRNALRGGIRLSSESQVRLSSTATLFLPQHTEAWDTRRPRLTSTSEQPGSASSMPARADYSAETEQIRRSGCFVRVRRVWPMRVFA
jgi:hypothetical protein